MQKLMQFKSFCIYNRVTSSYFQLLETEVGYRLSHTQSSKTNERLPELLRIVLPTSPIYNDVDGSLTSGSVNICQYTLH